MLLVYIMRILLESGFRETKEISADNCNFHSPLALYTWYHNHINMVK